MDGVQVVPGGVGVRGRAVGERAEHVHRHLLDEAGRHCGYAVRAVAEDRLDPAHGARVEDAGPACVRVVGRITEARRPLAHQRRVGQDLDRPRHRVGRVDPVVLDADQVGEARPRGHPGPGEHPAVRGRHHVRSDRGIALVKRPDQRGLRVRPGRLAPVAGDKRVLDAEHRIARVTGLVADDEPVRAERGGVQPDPPEHRVGSEERQVDACVAGRGHVRAFGRGPVLVVPGRDQGAGPVQQVRVGGDVHAGQVGQRQAHALGQLDHVPLVGEQHGRAVGVVRPVQADGQRPCAVAGPGAGVQVVAAPGVVGLPGGDAVLDHDLTRGAGRADRHRHVPLRAGVRVQPEQVQPRRPVVGRHLGGRVPVGPYGVGGPGQAGAVLPVTAQRA